MGPRGRYKFDKANFQDIKEEISAREIEGYYNLKDTYYIQIGTHGFFLLGDKDPLKLNQSNRERGLKPIPRFSNSCVATGRIRCQPKGVTKAEQRFVQTGDIFGPNGYQFSFEMQIKGLKKYAKGNLFTILLIDVSPKKNGFTIFDVPKEKFSVFLIL